MKKLIRREYSMPQLIAILCGGPSAEHDVSLTSAARVHDTLKPRGDVLRVTVNRTGTRWNIDDAGHYTTADALAYLKRRGAIAFIAMHGTFGEDGTVQRLLDDAGVPYTGSGPEASALAMDKVRAAEMFAACGLHVPRAVPWTITSPSGSTAFRDAIIASLTFPVILKPSDLGSSVGIAIADDATELDAAIAVAAEESPNLVAQEFLRGRELTCAILDSGDAPTALPITEIVPLESAFFDFSAKYAPGASHEITPANLSESITTTVQAAAITAHTSLGCRGMSRSDFILVGDTPYILETNTIPGLTPTSLLPQAAAAAGIDFATLLDRIIAAVERPCQVRNFLLAA